MAFMDKVWFSYNEVIFVTELLEKWAPVNCKREKDFEVSLFSFLHERLPNFQITKQFGIGRTKADLVLEKRLAVEMKHNLDTTGKYQRLVGQLMDYNDWNGCVIVVLTGRNDQELVKRLRDFAEKQSNRLTFAEAPKFSLFVKESWPSNQPA